MTTRPTDRTALAPFHPAVRDWFAATFTSPTAAQTRGWPSISRGDSTLVLAPTGSGKTLAAFLWCVNRLMFDPEPPARARCRVVYISPLKALAVDVERNLRGPLAGITATARSRGDVFHLPAVAVRTGDTPAAERTRLGREPADILITTPESLYLVLTSRARETLRSVDTVIVDEIHALVPTKRGAHLALSLERLERLAGRPLQRIGLSATVRPLDEVARFLAGARPSSRVATRRTRRGPGLADLNREFGHSGRAPRFRSVAMVDAGIRKPLELRIELPTEHLSPPGETDDRTGGAQVPRTTIWSAIHPRLLALVRQHESTLIFVNSRRLAERLAAALNDLAGCALVRAHHGSMARPQRLEVEEGLKAGRIKGLVATSSLELGIDMGAIDLVVQIEAPPSVASGLQRIGRAGHRVDAASRGVIFPKYRGDLLAAAAVSEAMHRGDVEASRYPRNPLDVLAQQIVAMVAMEPWKVDELYELVRSAAPFATLSRTIFDGVLDMLAGRYPSDEFAELRPRVTWNRLTGTLEARAGARTVAVINAGTIPDRGLYGVFLAGGERGASRVGELDEEMVFESQVGDVFLLGASSWRIEEITHDRVLVTPAPGEPGRMPFWRGDAAGRPVELGRQIGKLVRDLAGLPPAAGRDRLMRRHDLDAEAADTLLAYLGDQRARAGAAPDDRTVVVERYRDELGAWRLCLLSPFGGKILAPWALAVAAKFRDDLGIDVETLWSNDGFVVRCPDTEAPPDTGLLLPASDEIERLVVGQLGASALFAAKFREAAGRALLLPRRRPGGRAPLWQQRRRAADLLAVASRFGSFPILLEAYRECLRDVFDLPSLQQILSQISRRWIRVVTLSSDKPSPFATSLMFGYVANYIYDGDAPLAERRAQALAIDQAQLSDLLGDAELRELIDPGTLEAIEQRLQYLDVERRVRTADGLHDLLLRLGDLSRSELAARSAVVADRLIEPLVREVRAIEVAIAGEARYIAVEDAGRYRDALGVRLPAGVPAAFLERAADPVGDLVKRYARTHGPFTIEDVAGRYGMDPGAAEAVIRRLVESGRVVEGEFRPGGLHRECCDAEVLRSVRHRSLARLRREVEPVDPPVLGRLVTVWQGIVRRRRGLDALLDAIESLQGAALPASIVETEILPARIEDYAPADLDKLAAAGEVVWCGVEPLGERDGRVALYLTDQIGQLRRPSDAGGTQEGDGREQAILTVLAASGASFFTALHEATGGGYPGETVDALWRLVWRGQVTNDTFHALRAFTHPPLDPRRTTGGAGEASRLARISRRSGAAPGSAFRSRRAVPPAAEGRWSLVAPSSASPATATAWCTALARQLLARYGIVSREIGEAESLPGGFTAIYDVLKRMEETGKIRRGYFVAGVGAAQFALPAALELLRSLKQAPETPEVVRLAATDPANPYGAILPWPPVPEAAVGRGPTRTVGSRVVLVDGALVAHVKGTGRHLLVFLAEQEPDRTTQSRALARELAAIAATDGLLIAAINGAPAAAHSLAAFLSEAGFAASSMGYHVRRPHRG